MTVNLDLTRGTWHPAVWYYHLRRTAAEWDVTPVQVTVVYLLLGFLALYFSDVVLVGLVEDPARLSRLQAIKGGAEVVLTGGLVLGLARRSRRTLSRTNDRLERQREELEVLHRVLRHNLRNDVTVITGYGTSLLEEVDDARHRDWCRELVRVADRIVHYAEQTRKINRVTSNGAARPIDLVETVEAAVAGTDGLDGAAVELDVPESVLVRANPMLQAAIGEVLTNAVRHHDGDDPRVAVTVDPGGGASHRAELVVADDGPGVPAHVRATIAGRGESQLLHLDGLGLWLVSWVVTVSDGSLTIDDREPRGTAVRVELPKAAAEAVPQVAGAGEAHA